MRDFNKWTGNINLVVHIFKGKPPKNTNDMTQNPLESVFFYEEEAAEEDML